MNDRLLMLRELEKKLKISLDNLNTLDIALTHSSYANGRPNIEFYERLEFLGDSVLQLSISDYLFKNYKDKAEGELTKLRSLVVCENSLFIIAKSWDLGKYIRMSKGEEMTGGRTRVSILADCVEAIIAAIYLDKGFTEAKDFIYKNLGSLIEKAINNEIILDYKTKLQETLQKHGDISIIYNLEGFEGPPHRRKFNISLTVNGIVRSNGSGYSKKEAEQNAAKAALKLLEEKHE